MGRASTKFLYTILELLLVWLAISQGGWALRFPLLYLIIVIRSCLIFEFLGRLIVAGLVFLSFLFTLLLRLGQERGRRFPKPSPFWNSVMPRPPHHHPFPRGEHPPRVDPEHIGSIVLHLTLSNTFLFGLVLVFVLLLINALLAERNSRQKLAIAHEQLRQYALQIEDQATLQERNRIAREIHDSLGHALTAQSIQLENALVFCPSNAEKTKEFLSEAKRLGANALKEVRQSVSALRSNLLQEESLEAAIADLVESFQTMTTLQPDCTINIKEFINPQVKTAIYRIVQEALTNIYKHSAATQVTIQVIAEMGQLHLWLKDNGSGFNLEQNTTGFGLQGMRERTLALGGQFSIVSAPNQGTQIKVMIPLLKIPRILKDYG